MNVKELAQKLNLEIINLSDGDREIRGGYVGDLLSWVMGRASADDAWVTIMSNLNVIAVASLVDVACVVIAEGVKLEDDVIQAAISQNINVLKSDKNAFKVCADISNLL